LQVELQENLERSKLNLLLSELTKLHEEKPDVIKPLLVDYIEVKKSTFGLTLDDYKQYA
jgi:hypothetical protein